MHLCIIISSWVVDHDSFSINDCSLEHKSRYGTINFFSYKRTTAKFLKLHHSKPCYAHALLMGRP